MKIITKMKTMGKNVTIISHCKTILLLKIDLIVFFFVLFSGENLTDPTRPTFRYSLHCSQLKTADPELNRKP